MSIVSGTLSKELEVKATAAEAWNIYGTLKLGRLAAEKLPDVVHKLEVLEGDGGVGTVLKITFPPGKSGGPTYTIEKFTVVDDEKRLKVLEVIEGGQLALGFTQFRVQFQMKEKDKNSCITKITTEYEIGEDAFGKVSMASAAMPYVALLKVVAHSLTD